MVHINHINTMCHNNIYLIYAHFIYAVHVIPSIKLGYQLFNNVDKH
jgi:hypothetical protein